MTVGLRELHRRELGWCALAWAEFAGIFSRTRAAHLEHEQAKAELKKLVPEDAHQAIGHGLQARRSKSGAISFDLLSEEGAHA